jgi:acyl-CoA thioesterase-1
MSLTACFGIRPACLAAAALLLAAPWLEAAPRQEPRTILFLGDSLTAGYGLMQEQSFPALIGERLEEQGLRWEVINAGVPGDTSAGGLRRIDWLLRRRVDILFLELGANDMLRGLPLDITRENLQAIIDKARAAYPGVEVVIAGMLAPPNLGEDYTGEFRDIFPGLAEANDAALVPFLLEGVAARPELNLPDGIHPNVEGQRIVADGVWRVLEPLFRASAIR